MNESNVKVHLEYQPLDREELSRFCSDKSIQALDSSMSALVRGRAPTPSFKLYGKTDQSLAIRFLDSIRAKNLIPDWMRTYEWSRLSKWGPQGGYKPWSELKELLELYYTRPEECHVKDTVMQLLRKKYGSMHLIKMAATDTLSSLINADKIQERAAGWSTYDLKKTDRKAQVIAINYARKGLWKYGRGYVFSRFNKQKMRIFMPMPFSSMIVQAQYYLNFLAKIQQDLIVNRSRSKFLFWADKVGLNNGVMLMILQETLDRCPDIPNSTYLYVQRDFEKMDTTMGLSQYQRVVVPLIAAAYGFKETSLQYQELSEVMNFTVTCPIDTPDGCIPLPHGTASGAEVTNGGETLGNDAYDSEIREELIATCKQKNVRFSEVYSLGNGDDGASLFKVAIDQVELFKHIYSTIANNVAKRHGYRVQAQKWHLSTVFGLYCQYMLWIDKMNKIHQAYPAVLILNSIVNPERQYSKSEWDKDYRDLDIIAKLDNGYGLPYFTELVDYVDKGMKFRLLGRSERETRRILSKYDRWVHLQDSSEFFNKRPFTVGSSPTIQYLLNTRRISID
jgi:hypothetical protein